MTVKNKQQLINVSLLHARSHSRYSRSSLEYHCSREAWIRSNPSIPEIEQGSGVSGLNGARDLGKLGNFPDITSCRRRDKPEHNCLASSTVMLSNDRRNARTGLLLASSVNSKSVSAIKS